MSRASWPNVSPSRAADLVCRKKYYTLHVLGHKPQEPFSPQMTFGSGIHALLKGVYDPASPVAPGQRDLHRLARAAFSKQPYPDPALREDDTARALAWVEAYVNGDQEPGDTIGVEVFDSLRITDNQGVSLSFGVRYDHLLVRKAAPDILVIRDYKTGQLRQIDLEGACILIAVARARYNRQYASMCVEYDYLGSSGLAQRICVGIADVKPLWPELRERIKRVYNATEFLPEPGEHCCFCALRPECQPSLSLPAEDIGDLLG